MTIDTINLADLIKSAYEKSLAECGHVYVLVVGKTANLCRPEPVVRWRSFNRSSRRNLTLARQEAALQHRVLNSLIQLALAGHIALKDSWQRHVAVAQGATEKGTTTWTMVHRKRIWRRWSCD